MADEITTIQIKVSTREKVRALAGEDYRSMAAELEWLVDQEYSRRHPQPDPCPPGDDSPTEPKG
jgi:hypothetical protein